MQSFSLDRDYTLEDSRVLLRSLKEDDFENLLPFALNEPELWQFSLLSGVGEEGLKAYLSNALKLKKAGLEYPFIVWDKQNAAYAGSTRFYDIHFPLQTLQLGYTWYGKTFQGTGLNRHCKFLLLSFAFEKMGMQRVEFRADNNNVRSIAAMKSLGCKVDGILRANMPKRDGGRRDSIVLSILADEWHKNIKQELMKKLQ